MKLSIQFFYTKAEQPNSTEILYIWPRKKLAPPTHVSDHECYDCGMSDILRHDTFYTFVREHAKQNNRIYIYFKTGILRYMNTFRHRIYSV